MWLWSLTSGLGQDGVFHDSQHRACTWCHTELGDMKEAETAVSVLKSTERAHLWISAFNFETSLCWIYIPPLIEYCTDSSDNKDSLPLDILWFNCLLSFSFLENCGPVSCRYFSTEALMAFCSDTKWQCLPGHQPQGLGQPKKCPFTLKTRRKTTLCSFAVAETRVPFWFLKKTTDGQCNQVSEVGFSKQPRESLLCGS